MLKLKTGIIISVFGKSKIPLGISLVSVSLSQIIFTFEDGTTTQIALLRWPNVGSTLYTTMAHGQHTTLDQCSFDRWRMVG